MTREEAEEQLTGIARGKAVKIGDQLLVATYSERIKAMAQLGKMRGWETPIKTETTLYGTAINIQVVDSKLPLVSNEQEVG
jgi:hypothetical protein